MGKKKEEFKLPPGTPEPWMSTFSDMMTLLMCFFVLLFSMSTVDAAKFEEVAKSFQSTFSIFRGGAQAIGDGILVSNGVSQLNMLDEYINSSGKTADADSKDQTKLDKTEQASADTEPTDATAAAAKDAAELLGLTQQEVQELQDTVEQIEEEKLKVSEALAEKIK